MEKEFEQILEREAQMQHDIRHYEQIMEEENMEKMLKIAEELEQIETEYADAKHELGLLKAQYQLFNDWEKVLGKDKPTVSEKEAYIKTATEEQERRVNHLKAHRNFTRRVYEINILAMQD